MVEHTVEELLDVIDDTITFLEHADVSSGYCCCGASMDCHGDVFETGHQAYDAGHYAITQQINYLKTFRKNG